MNTDNIQRIKHYLEESENLGLEAFKKGHPWPVLIVMGGIIDPESAFQTRVSNSTDTLDIAGIQYRFDPNARVFPVVKQDGANPYTQMIIIGRTGNTDIQLRSSEISKMHAFITWQETAQGKTYKIADGKSRNGTWLGQKKLRPNRVYDLQSGSILGMGGSMFLRFLMPADFYRTLTNMRTA